MSHTVKITNVSAPRLKCAVGAAETNFWDAELKGFGVRAFRSGRRVFVVQYRTKTGKQAKVTLGVIGVVTADKAREEAKNLLAQVQLGGDPQARSRAKRKASTVLEVAERYLDHSKARLKPRSYKEVERALLKTASPLHFEKAEDVSRRSVADLLDNVVARSGPAAANRSRSYLSAMWSWALKTGTVEGTNPVAITVKAAEHASRDRVLTDYELATIWHCTNSGDDYDRIVRLLMLTAVRRDEVGSMQWAEVTNVAPNTPVWTVPGERTKNHLAHEIPLTALAIEQLPKPRAENPFVFGRTMEFPTGFSGWSHCKARLDKNMTVRIRTDFEEQNAFKPTDRDVPLIGWRLHDFRRTFSTWANDTGFEPHVVEAALNHISGPSRAGVAGVYNRAQYRGQKAAVLSAWEQHVRAIIGMKSVASNVFQMQPGR